MEATTDRHIPRVTQPEGRTDLANARRLAAKHGTDLRYVSAWGTWLSWDGRRWSPSHLAAERLPKQVGDAIWQELATMGSRMDASAARELFAFAKYTTSASGQRNMMRLAQSEPGIPITPEKLDAHPWLVNAANGTIDLRTGQLRPHRREDLITKLCPVQYDPLATCPTWERFLDDVMAEQRGMVAYLQRALGSSLAGVVRDHVLHVAYGTGANGKSTLLNAVLEATGTDYAMQAAPDLLMAKPGSEHPTALADLFGKRFVACIESDDNRRLAEGLVKSLTGGDRIRARRMREDYWEFAPTHHVWLATNHRPTIRGTDPGIWRRIRLIPFAVSIPPERQDRQLAERLRDERPGILRWLVDGCLAWQRSGLAEPDEVVGATAGYRDDQDTFAAFLDESADLSADHRERASTLYAAYIAWAQRAGEHVQTQTRFGSAMDERGFHRRKIGGVKWYCGIRLRPANDDVLGTPGTVRTSFDITRSHACVIKRNTESRPDCPQPSPTEDPDDYEREERAAIYEYDVHIPRAEAERLAGVTP